MVDYSRFDDITGESSDEEDASASRGPGGQPNPPTDVMDDLEDYFRRMEERQLSRAASNRVAPPSVDRFSRQQIASLPSSSYTSKDAAYDECSVCLADFSDGDEVVQLPCAAAHIFHKQCAAECLSRSKYCPLCRVDLLPIMVAKVDPPSQSEGSVAGAPSAEPEAPLSPRQLGFTRDGGVILRYEPSPPQEMPRPAYIPPELREQASFVEIQYPDQGVARIWRVPRGDEE